LKKKFDMKKRKSRLEENFEELVLFEEDLPEAS
jgi:hypothetical protein